MKQILERICVKIVFDADLTRFFSFLLTTMGRFSTKSAWNLCHRTGNHYTGKELCHQIFLIWEKICHPSKNLENIKTNSGTWPKQVDAQAQFFKSVYRELTGTTRYCKYISIQGCYKSVPYSNIRTKGDPSWDYQKDLVKVVVWYIQPTICTYLFLIAFKLSMCNFCSK